MQRAGYKATLGYVPEQGTRFVPVKLPFNANAVTSISDDLFPEQSLSELEYIQAVYIDNADNAQKLTLQVNGGSRIVAKANSQGFYPLVTPNGKFSYSASTTGNVDINIIFLNIFINAIIWPNI